MIAALTLPLALAARPASVGFTDSAHVRCHYESGSDVALCAEVLVWAEEAWSAQVDRIGFRPPLPDDGEGGSDALDIYLTREAGGAGSAWVDCDGGDPNCLDPDPTDALAEAPSYVVIDPRTDAEIFRSYVHHELCHTYQYATDFTEPFLSLWEGTAVACEQWTDPSWPTLAEDFGDYQATPWLSTILHDGYFLADIGVNDDSWYEYGAVAWVWYMDHEYGAADGTLLPQVWELAGQPDATVLDAWQELSGDLRASLLEFTAQRARMGGEGAPEWSTFAGEYAPAWREGELRPEVRVHPTFEPYPQGVSFYEVPEETDGFLLDFKGDDAVEWAVLEVTPTQWAEISGDVPLTGGSTLAVVNLGPPGFTAADELLPAGFTLRAEGAACGCASARAPAGLWLGWLAWVVARRRVRAA